MQPLPDNGFGQRLNRLREQMDHAAAQSPHTTGATLLAVSKTFPAERVIDAYRHHGLICFGESRVQEALPKMDAVAMALPDAAIDWHLIGHLQKNKVAKAVGRFSLIHTVDSEPLAARIDRIAGERGQVQKILIQVNVSGEAQKSGIAPALAIDLVAAAATMPHLQVCGLMGMAPKGQSEPAFSALWNIFDTIKKQPPAGATMDTLSMGMSGDFASAIAHGATLVRVGSALFGERQPL